MATIQTEHIKQIQVLLGDDTFGDYVRIQLSNPDYYSIEDFNQAQYYLRAGYFDGTNSYLEKVFEGYTLIGNIETSSLPKDIEFSIQNKFFSLGRLILGSHEFNGLTLQEAIEFFQGLINLPSDNLEVNVSSDLLNKEIIRYEVEKTTFLEVFQKVMEAFNLWAYWTYDGNLRITERSIPSASSFTVAPEKAIIKEEIRPFRLPSLIQVVGRNLNYWEQTGTEITLFQRDNLALNHTWLNGLYSTVYSQTFKFLYFTKPSFATSITISPNSATCGSNSGTLYEYEFVDIKTDYCQAIIRVIDKPLYECCLNSSNENTYRQIFFNLEVRGYRISNNEKYSRIYVEYEDTEAEIKQGGRIIRRVDNGIIQDTDVANRILNFEKVISKMEQYPVSIEIPLMPLIERYDRITVQKPLKSFDVLITSIEHNFFPESGKSKTILKGYKIV